jgi:hypothetical protein
MLESTVRSERATFKSRVALSPRTFAVASSLESCSDLRSACARHCLAVLYCACRVSASPFFSLLT